MADTALIANLDIWLRGNNSKLDSSLDKSTSALSKFKDKTNQQAGAIDNRLSSIGSNASTAFQNALQSPVTALTGILKTLGNAVLHPFDTAKTGITSLLSTFRSVGDSLLASAKNTFGKTGATIANMASSIPGISYLLPVLATGIGAVAVAAVVAAGAVLGFGAALVYLGNKQAETIELQNRMAATLGMQTSKFSALAATSKMEVEAFTSGLSKLQRGISEAAQNGGGLATSLQRVGLRVEDLVNMSPEQQLDKLAVAFQRITNQADRLALAQELFGKGGGFDFARILGGGPEQLQKMLDKADKFGLAFTQQQAEMVEKSNAAWKGWSNGLKGVGNTIAIALAPAWEYIGTIIGDFFAKISQWTRAALPYFQLLWTGIKTVADAIGEALSPIWKSVESGLTVAFGYLKTWIDESLPIVKELWAIFKIGFDFVVTSFRIGVNFIMGLLGDMIGGINLNLGSWTEWKSAILRFLITLEFGFKNYGTLVTLMIDTIKLKWQEYVGWFGVIVNNFLSKINILIDAYNKLAEKTGAPLVSRIRIEYPDSAQLNRQINELRQSIAQRQGALDTNLAAFIDQRLAELNRVSESMTDTVRQQGRSMGTNVKTNDNKAAERGSAEAFSIIVGDKEDKNYQAQMTIIDLLREQTGLTREEIRAIQNRGRVAVSRL